MIDKLPDTSYTRFHHTIGRDDHQLSMMIKSKEHYDRIVNQIKLDHGMWQEASKLLNRESKKNNQINEAKQDLEDLYEITQYVIKAHNDVIDERNNLKFINGKVIEAKKKITRKLSDTIQQNIGLNYINSNLKWNKDLDVKLIELLRSHLKEKIIHVHKSGVIHLQEKDLENLKEYRDKYKTLRELLRDKYLEACKSSQYVTAGIYAELFSAE